MLSSDTLLVIKIVRDLYWNERRFHRSQYTAASDPTYAMPTGCNTSSAKADFFC